MPKLIKDIPGTRHARWRPIATAPKSGEVRLLAFAQGVVEIGFWGWGGISMRGQNTWRDVRWRAFRQRPTHWMPLPRPPLNFS